MKGLSVSELNNVVKALRVASPLRLQSVATAERDLILEFYSSLGKFWLWIDLEPKRPLVLWLTQLPCPLPKGTAPMRLFIKAHLLDLNLRGAQVPEGMGRLLHLNFADDELAQIEVRLFPHGQNVLVRAKGKSIAWHKPQVLKETEGEAPESAARTPEVIEREWKAQRFGGKKGKATAKENLEERRAQAVAKKRKALETVERDVQEKERAPWRAIGEFLRRAQSLDVPEEWRGLIDMRKSVFQNVEMCFAKAKELEGKLEGSRERLKQLQEELKDLESAPLEALVTNPSQKDGKKSVAAPKGLDLGEGLRGLWGKSGKDNLRLLRESRPWYLWVHVKDYPGSHGIIQRTKTQKVSDDQIRELGLKLLEVARGKKQVLQPGERYELLVSECRYVRPIAGDKLGRVTYQEARTVPLKIAAH